MKFGVPTSAAPIGWALLSGGLLVLAFPPFEWSLLAWVGLTPLLIALAHEKLTLKQSLWLGELTGLVFLYGSCHWLSFSMVHYGGLPPVLAYALLLIPGLVLGAFYALFSGAVWAALRRRGAVGIWSAPALWVLAEWLRLEGTGIGWNALGYSQAFHPRVIQLAECTGVYGVSFLLVLVAAGLTYGILRLGRTQSARRTIVVWAFLLMGVFGAVLLSARDVTEHSAHQRLRVMAVQPNIPIEVMGDPAAQSDAFERLVELTDTALASSPPAGLVIWPESPLNFSLTHSPEVTARLTQLVRRHQVHLLLNVIGWSPPDRVHNSLAVLAPNGRTVGRYDKVRLLPFGEYVPLRGVLPFIDQIPALAGDFAPGTDVSLLGIKDAQVGGSICFEAMFPDISRRMAQRGAVILVNVSNYGWFGPSAAARQHLAHAVFRAVETRRPLLCVTNNGISAQLSPRGEVIEEAGLFKTVWQMWTVEYFPQPPMTFYTLYGDVFVLVCGVIVGLFFVLGPWSLGRKRIRHGEGQRTRDVSLILRDRAEFAVH
jgi:apolipoprotein N-acyltransferase